MILAEDDERKAWMQMQRPGRQLLSDPGVRPQRTQRLSPQWLRLRVSSPTSITQLQALA